MYQVFYYIGFALIALAALGVFACLAHAIYKDFKETPLIKTPGKILGYLVVFIIGASIIIAGQYFAQDSEYVQNLHRAWFGFEGIYK